MLLAQCQCPQITMPPKSIDERLTNLEELVTHLEHTLQELHTVILDQQQRIESFDQRMARLAAELDVAIDEAGHPRTLEDDKPPHY